MGFSNVKVIRQTHVQPRYPICSWRLKAGWDCLEGLSLHPFWVLSELNKIIGQPGGVEELENWLSSEKHSEDPYSLVEQMTD